MFTTEWASEGSEHAKVSVFQRLASGEIEVRRLEPFEALQWMDYDPRNGVDVIGAWIVWGDITPWR